MAFTSSSSILRSSSAVSKLFGMVTAVVATAASMEMVGEGGGRRGAHLVSVEPTELLTSAIPLFEQRRYTRKPGGGEGGGRGVMGGRGVEEGYG